MVLDYVLGLLMAASLATGPAPAQERADLRVTQRYLVPLCLDGHAVTAHQRRWKVGPGEHTLVFTMHNDPRPGMGGNEEPGRAAIHFTAAAGGRYEVETRAGTLTYSRRVWKEGEWKPVVRERRSDTLVSSEPTWSDSNASGCH
jgi:hypothetical protein